MDVAQLVAMAKNQLLGKNLFMRSLKLQLMEV